MNESGITPEEADALTATEPTPETSGVRPRDFRLPRRLSSEQLEELRVRISLDLKSVAKVLKPWFRANHALTLETISEVSFHGIPDAIEDRVCVMRFKVADKVGWVVWETEAAFAATACAMGVEPPAKDEEEEGAEDSTPNEAAEAGDSEQAGAEEATESSVRPEKLSSVEDSIARKILGELLSGLGSTLGFQASDYRLLQSLEELEHSIVELRGTDAQRLRVDLQLDGPGAPSELKFYLPGVVPASSSPDQASSQPTNVPAHLSNVMLELSAEFDSVELPLDELLSLEVGDVISLATRVEDPINLTVEDLVCAKVHLGKKDGQIAVQLESLILDSIPKG